MLYSVHVTFSIVTQFVPINLVWQVERIFWVVLGIRQPIVTIVAYPQAVKSSHVFFRKVDLQ